MNSLERFSAALEFQSPDRTPVITQVVAHAAALSGETVHDYVRSGELAARCQIRALERYGYDSVLAFFDLSVECEALGCKLRYPRDLYPAVESYALSPTPSVERLRLPNPRSAGRMPEVLRAASILRREVGSEVAVVSALLGPMTLAGQLIGLDSALYLMADDPARLERLLDFTTEAAIVYGRALVESGVHVPIVGEPAGSPAVVAPAFFREALLPRLARIFSALKQAGAAASWLYIAGPSAPILPWYAKAKVEVAHFDYEVSARQAIAALPTTCLAGNLKPMSFVLETPEAVAAQSEALLDEFADRSGFVLSCGSEVPVEARPENVAAMVAAARRRPPCRPSQ